MIEGSIHRTNWIVRGYELDSYGHVNNAVYLQYYEQARWEMMREMNLLDQFLESDLLLVVVEAYVRYMRELSLLDELIIESTCKIEEPYLVFYQKILTGSTKIKVSRAKIKTIFTGKDKIPLDIPAYVKESISKNR